MKTILAVLMIPAALFATWATSFVQSAVREAKAETEGVGTQAERVKERLNQKVETLRGSFLMDTKEPVSVGAALRKGQASIDRALGRPTRDRQAYEDERMRLAKEIDRERSEIRAIRAADAAVEAARLREALEEASDAGEEAVDPALLEEARKKAAAAIEKAKREVKALPPPVEETRPEGGGNFEKQVEDLERETDKLEREVK